MNENWLHSRSETSSFAEDYRFVCVTGRVGERELEKLGKVFTAFLLQGNPGENLFFKIPSTTNR